MIIIINTNIITSNHLHINCRRVTVFDSNRNFTSQRIYIEFIQKKKKKKKKKKK
jgi:hypothetical protein